MKPKALIVLVASGALALLLGGCQPTLVRQSTDSGWIEVPSGSTLSLNRPVSIQPGRARAYLVDRGARADGDGTSCVLEVRRIDEANTQTVPAGVIPITRVQNYVALVSSRSRVPESGPGDGVRFQLASHGDSGGSQMIRQGYHFWLDDSHDPNLMRMTCLGRLDDPAYTRAPTLAEIRAVLGDVATLEVVLPTEP